MSRDLRGDLLACYRAGLRAVDPEELVAVALAAERRRLVGRRVLVAAIGKAAVGMARGAARALTGHVAGGVVIAPRAAGVPPALRVFEGGHPLPDESGVAGARAVRDVAAAAGPEDLLLVLLSGGGSALMTLPAAGLSLDDLRRTHRLLLLGGADVASLNTVRRHLDQLKGGRLAALAHPAAVLALVISDVVGDPLEMIASGPTVGDPTSYGDALAVLQRYRLLAKVPPAVRRHLEAGARGERDTPPGPRDPRLRSATTLLVGSNRTALVAAAEEAARLGYRPTVLTTHLSGEARERGRTLGAVARRAVARAPAAGASCLLAGGETTVTVTGPGRGGRNLELALGAAPCLAGASGLVLASLATDGVDGTTDAAGAFVDGTTLDRARAMGLDDAAALAANDTYPFFAALGDLVRTGPTGTNVMDLVLALSGGAS